MVYTKTAASIMNICLCLPSMPSAQLVIIGKVIYGTVPLWTLYPGGIYWLCFEHVIQISHSYSLPETDPQLLERKINFILLCLLGWVYGPETVGSDCPTKGMRPTLGGQTEEWVCVVEKKVEDSMIILVLGSSCAWSYICPWNYQLYHPVNLLNNFYCWS